MKRTARLFALTEYLRGRRTGVTAETLAERFGVTVRTIYRDLDALRDASLPLGAERGPGGGFALDRSYTLPPVNFSAREAAVLVAAGAWLQQMRVMPFTATLTSALDKVRGALTTSSQRELHDVLQSLQFVGVPALAVEEAVRAAVEEAWFTRQALWIRYRAPSKTSERVIKIESIVMERSVTLLNATDVKLQASRQFQLNRIEAAEVRAPDWTPQSIPTTLH